MRARVVPSGLRTVRIAHSGCALTPPRAPSLTHFLVNDRFQWIAVDQESFVEPVEDRVRWWHLLRQRIRTERGVADEGGPRSAACAQSLHPGARHLHLGRAQGTKSRAWRWSAATFGPKVLSRARSSPPESAWPVRMYTGTSTNSALSLLRDWRKPHLTIENLSVQTKRQSRLMHDSPR